MTVAIGGGAAFGAGVTIAHDDLSGGHKSVGAIPDGALHASVGRSGLRRSQGRKEEDDNQQEHCLQDSEA